VNLSLSNTVSCEFRFKTKFLFRNAYDKFINNQSQTFMEKLMKNNIFPKEFKAVVLSLMKNLNDMQQIDRIKTKPWFLN